MKQYFNNDFYFSLNFFKNKNLKIYFTIILLILILLFTFSCSKNEKKETNQTLFGPTYDAGEIIVNLADMGQARYAKIQTVFELPDEKTLDEIKKREPQIKDAIIEIFSSKQAEQFLEIKSRNEIKQEILNKINLILKSGKVKNVYFTNIVVQ
jgi:flagellar FliL protein